MGRLRTRLLFTGVSFVKPW